MAEITQFDIGQGETFRVLLTVTDTDTGNPLNLADYTLTGLIRENFSTTDLAGTFTFENAIPLSSGSVFVGLTPAQTMLLTQRKYVYDINLIKTSDNQTRRVLEGYLVVRPTTMR